jgi:GMP synthase (glutamine-hydrolysing)
MGRTSSKAAIQTAPHSIAILDAGAQYGGLIDRNVRELGFRTTLLPLDTPARNLKKYSAIIISGGPKNVAEADAYQCDPELLKLGLPILGICYGMQLMAQLHGGKVGEAGIREDGPQNTTFMNGSLLFDGLAGVQRVLMTHGVSVLQAPANFIVSGKSEHLISAIENAELKQYGVQFHPEVFQTECGPAVFRNFLFKIADLHADYSIEDQEIEAIHTIQEIVKDKDVVVFVSGGVDSAVVAALIAKSVPKAQIHAFHIDTGFMRKNESKTVITALENAGIEVTLLDMVDLFHNATTIIDGVKTPPLSKVIDPQVKRKIIGDTFITVRNNILRDYKLAGDSILAQGSLRPDLIESGSSLASTKADTIKTHHNDTEKVRELRMKNHVVEPLQQMYKDQVRTLGKRLGLPSELVERHPFPGPGLAIRVICADKPYRLPNHETLQTELDSFLVSHGYDEFQAHLLPVQTVGVQGDGRSYKYLAGITGPKDWNRLRSLSAIIPNHNHAINRVSYLFGESVDRSSLDITPTHLTKDTLDQLRQADDIVTEVLRAHDLMPGISQMPVILFPVNFGSPGAHSIALRPFKTPDFMTGLAITPGKDLPEAALEQMVERILKEVPHIARVAFDLSSKPPGTTEWE